MIPFKLKLKFMKWALVTAAITITEMALVPILCTVLIPKPYATYAIIANIAIGMPIGLYYFILVMSGYKERCRDYLKLKEIHTTYPDKPLSKFLMMQMDESLCEREVSRQLRKEFPDK